MKILMISRKFGSLGDLKTSYGPYTFVSRLIGGLSKHHELFVVTSGSKNFTRVKHEKNVKIVEIPSFPKDPFKMAYLPRYIKKSLIETIRPDIIHSQDIEGAFLFKSYKGGIPKVISVKSDILGVESKRKSHNSVKEKIGRAISLIIEKTAIKNSDYIIVPSNYLKEELIKYYDVKGGKITVIHNGTDTHTFRPMKKLDHMEKKFRPNGEKIIFSTSNGKRKGLDVMLKSFNLIKKNIPKSRLILGGVSNIEKFKHIIDAKNVKEKDIVLLGKIPNSEMPRYYNLCDVFALPTFHETFGNVFAEAMACEKPIVAFKTAAVPEIVTGKEGILTDPGDIAAFSEAVEFLLKNKSKSEKLGKSGRKRAIKKFSMEKNVQEHLKFYEKITEHHEI